MSLGFKRLNRRPGGPHRRPLLLTPYTSTAEEYEYGFEFAGTMNEYLHLRCHVWEDALRLDDPTDFKNKVL